MSDSSPGADGVRSRPWHREPLVWMVIAIPALTVVAGLTTVYLAHRGADPVVFDDMRKEGLAIHADPTRDHAALAAGVSATALIEPGRIRIQLHGGAAPAPGLLLALLSHATRAEYDQMIPLRAVAAGVYEAPLPALAPGHWYLELTPSDRSWRLISEFKGGSATLALAPRTTL